MAVSAKRLQNDDLDALALQYQVQASDDAFTALFKHFEKQISYHASKFTFRQMGTEDVQAKISEVLWNAASNWKSDRGARFKTYFWTCVHNEMISIQDKVNAKCREAEKTMGSLDAELTEDGMSLHDVLSDKTPSHERKVLLDSSVKKIAESLERPLDRRVLSLVVDEPRMTQLEIAKEVGKSDVAVSDSFARIRQVKELQVLLCN